MVVESDGPRGARLIVVGEALGEAEERLGKPFVGPAGRLLNECLGAVGFDRRDVYVTNVLCRRPPKNKIEAVPRAELDGWVDQLHSRLADLDDPWMIVPLGNLALKVLTGREGIMKHAGSVYEYEDRRGRVVKVMGNIHPAAVFRTPIWRKRVDVYWKKIAHEAGTRDVALPAREHFIRPTFEDVRWYLAEAREKAEVLSFDIETPRRVEFIPTILKSGKPGKPKKVYLEPHVGCIGFSWDPGFGICIPTVEEYWGSKAKLAAVWDLVGQLLGSPVEKVGQNAAAFDLWYLAKQGVRVRQFKWNLNNMHHAVDPCDDHDLAYLISVYLRNGYHKDEAKLPDEVQKYAGGDIDTWYTYNSKDATTQRALFEPLYEDLEKARKVAFYLRHYRNTFAPLLNISLTGMAVDNARRAELDQSLAGEVAELKEELTTLAGVDLYGKKNLSPKKLSEWLYGALKLPKQTSRATGQVSTSEVIIRRLMNRYPDRLGPAGEAILRIRRVQQVRTFLAEKRLSKDGRFRSSYGHAPESGRLSSSKAPDGTGSNAQNVDREIREIFVPSQGYVFVEVDLSQAESRVVGVLTKDPEMVRRARLLPGEIDEHRELAAKLFRVPEGKVTKEQRYIGKRVRHAVNYSMHGKRLAEELSKDGYTFTVNECESWVQLAITPPLAEWHRRVRQRVLRDRALTNPFGRTISFKYERMDDELYRRAYAFGPQSTVADILNQFGLVPLARWLESERVDARIVAHIHDALLIEARPEVAFEVARFLVESLERPVDYEGVELCIPSELKVGTSWKSELEWKRLPSRGEFEGAVAGLIGSEAQQVG